MGRLLDQPAWAEAILVQSNWKLNKHQGRTMGDLEHAVNHPCEKD